MQWSISATGLKKDILKQIDTEVEKYKAVDYYNNQLKLIKPFVTEFIKDAADTDTINVISAGGDHSHLARLTHNISVTII